MTLAKSAGVAGFVSGLISVVRTKLGCAQPTAAIRDQIHSAPSRARRSQHGLSSELGWEST